MFRIKFSLMMALAAVCLSHSPRLMAAVTFGDPQILASPAMPVTDGATVTLTAQAQPGSGSAIYQWQRNGVSILNAGRFSGAKTNRLVIRGIQKADQGDYTIQVREVLAGGVEPSVTSDPITVTVNVRPIIITQPAAPAGPVAQDGTLTLSVGISDQSQTPLTFEWQRNNVPIDSVANPSAATADFVIPSRDPLDPVAQPGVQWRDGGSYRVRVTNATGIQVFSKPVTVTVASAAVLLSDLPSEFFIPTKGSGKLSVLAGGTPKLFYQWSIDGEGNVTKGGNAASITIPGTPANNGKVYKVTVTNDATDIDHPAAVSSGATIRVINKLVVPDVSGNVGTGPVLKGATYDKGSAPVLEVQASLDNTGTLQYQWQKDGRNISDTATVSGTNARQLVFSDLAWDERGVYRCIVRNPVSVVTSKTFTLGVNSPPVIVTQPTASNVAITGGGASLTVVASGSGKLSYQWFRKGTGGDPDTPLPKATSNKLSLTKLLKTAALGDDYYCEVSNAFTDTLGGGSPTTTALANLVVYDQVRITTHPQAPLGGVRVDNTLSLSVGITGDVPVVYEWYLNTKTRLSNGASGSSTISGADTANLQITGMRAALQGNYTCIVRNARVPGTARYLANVTSRPARVVVVQPAFIVQQTSATPASPVVEDQTVTLSVLGGGAGPLRYQWQRSDNPLGGWVDLSGKTAAKLVFTKIQLEDDAFYRCRVDNILNEPVNSNPLALDVSPIPGAVITDFYPVAGITGDKVRVRGSNMQYVTSATIGNVTAAVSAEDNSSVLLTVPAGTNVNSPLALKLNTKNETTEAAERFTRTTIAKNDAPTKATILIGRSVTYTGSNLDFETSADFPSDTASSTAWFWWRAPVSGNYRITVNATSFDSGLSRYTGNIVTPTLSPPYQNASYFTGIEVINFAAVANTDYYFAVAGHSSDLYATYNGDFTLTLIPLFPAALEPPAGAALAAAEGAPAPESTQAFEYRLGGTDPQGLEPHTLTGLRLDPAAAGDQFTAHFCMSLDLPEGGVCKDGFAWTLFGADESPLAGFWIDAAEGSVSVSTTDGGYELTDVVLQPATPYEVEIWVDRAAGTWSAHIDGVPLAEPAPLPTGSSFVEVAPVWQPGGNGSPSASMSFRDLRLEVH